MVGITIGIGSWKSTAERAAKRMAEMTGLTCMVVDDQIAKQLPAVAHPSWLKCHLFKITEGIDAIMAFDADIICLRPWDPAAIFQSLGCPFLAVLDQNNRLVYNECRAHGLPFPDCYINGGLTIFGREHQPVWDAVWSRHPRYGSWLEQTALNRALLDLGVVNCRLPRRFNLLNSGGHITPGAPVLADTINLHCNSSGTPEFVQSCWDKYLPSADSNPSPHSNPTKHNPGTRLDLLATMPKAAVAAELGVFQGEFSEYILSVCRPSRLYMVDTFIGRVVSGDANGENLTSVEMADELPRLIERFHRPGRALVVRAVSWEWLQSEPENSLDFVYIDTDHTFRVTAHELGAARRAVRPGGIIAGHDHHPVQYPGVVQAVAQFIHCHRLQLELFCGDKLPSYRIVNTKSLAADEKPNAAACLAIL